MAQIRLFRDDNYEAGEISRTDSDPNLHLEGFGDGDCLATGQKTTFSSSLQWLFTLWILAGRLPSAPTPDVMAVRFDHSEQKRPSVQTLPPDHFIRLRDIFVPRAGGAEPGDAVPAQATRRG
jgi:hypothetical protein